MGSGSPPSQKPSAIPSHMINGNSPLQSSTAAGSGSGSGTRVRDARERESLNSSIQSSFAPRVPIEFDNLEAGPSHPRDPTSSESAAAASTHSTLTLRYDGYCRPYSHCIYRTTISDKLIVADQL
jgi:GTP cyclohydrolase I